VIHHYGLVVTTETIRKLLDIPEGIEIEFDYMHARPMECYIRLRSSEPFSINKVEAGPLNEAPWTPFENAVERHRENQVG
jgi:hypothetical protein